MDVREIRERRAILLVIFISVFAYILYDLYRDKQIRDLGVYSKGTVVKSEAYKGGIMITVRYKYKEVEYEEVVGSDLGKRTIGGQYFIQFRPSNPKTIVFYKKKPVPECLLNVEAPGLGWEKIPTCPSIK